MPSGDKLAAYVLVGLGAVVFLYGLIGLRDGGSIGPLGIGIVAAGLGTTLIMRGRREGGNDK